jgi:hypothetical protein
VLKETTREFCIYCYIFSSSDIATERRLEWRYRLLSSSSIVSALANPRLRSSDSKSALYEYKQFSSQPFEESVMLLSRKADGGSLPGLVMASENPLCSPNTSPNAKRV